MKGSIVVLSLLVLVASCIAGGKDGFAYEYQKFDNLIKNFKQPSQAKHIKNLKNAIPLRVVIDFDDLQKYGPKGVPADCFDDDGKAAYCQYDQMGENVVSSYVDVIVKLPYANYPYEADNVKEDDDSDKRQQLLDEYTAPVNASINQAVKKATCEVISNSISSVGYTTKFGFTVGIICPDDKTYRNNLATNPDFYNNVIDSKLGKTLVLQPNLASNMDLKSISNDFDGDLSEVKRKMDQVRVDSELAEEVERDVEKKQIFPSSTGYNYENSQCGGVWYNDYLDGAVDGNCIGGTCEYIKNGGKGTQFYLLDSGVNFRHQEFKKSYEEGRLLNHIVLNRTEYRRIHHQLVGSAYAGVLSPSPINLPDIPKDWRPFQTSPWKGLTRYPISPFSGRPIGRTNVYTRPIASLELALNWDYIEDPINDKISHGTSMAGIIIGDNLGIAKGSTLTSFKVLTAASGVVEYAMKAAFNRIIATQLHNNILRKVKPTVLVTGVNFIYPHECVTDTTNCAIDIISNIQIVIRLGVVFITPAMNGFINVRDYNFQPPGITVAKPFPSGFDICHWARYVRDVQPGADASYEGFPAYFPQMLISGDEIFPYTHIRPIRVTGFNPNIKMVPYVGKATDSIGNSVLDINGFNYGSCIDYAVPGSEIEKLTVLNKTVYGQMDVIEQLYAFTQTDSYYPYGITDWFPSDLPLEWEATGKSFPSGYKNYPFVSSGTSFSSPIAGVTIMSTLIAKWSTIKPTSPAAAGLFMKRVFQSVNELNLLPGIFSQPNSAYYIGYEGLENLNSIWGESDPEQSSYPLKKSPTYRPIKMNKVNPSC